RHDPRRHRRRLEHHADRRARADARARGPQGPRRDAGVDRRDGPQGGDRPDRRLRLPRPRRRRRRRRGRRPRAPRGRDVRPPRDPLRPGAGRDRAPRRRRGARRVLPGLAGGAGAPDRGPAGGVTVFDLDGWAEIGATLGKNKVRTALTAAGVFWGVFMLIALLAVGDAFRRGVHQNMINFAPNSIYVWSQRTTLPYQGLG